ncbi:MAG: hypothetical protein ACM3TN_22500 [Alphaproteobacteria bacterium]
MKDVLEGWQLQHNKVRYYDDEEEPACLDTWEAPFIAVSKNVITMVRVIKE